MNAIKNLIRNVNQNASCYSTIFKTIRRNILGKKFEPHVYLLDKFITSGSVCFDVGAAYGRYTLIMSRLAGASGRIHCFEPGDYSYQVLNNVVKFHRLKNVTIIKKGLCDKKGLAQLTMPIKSKGKLGASLAHLGSGAGPGQISQQIEITTIDDYCQEADINRLDFIKCDVEGAELLVFQGAEKAILKYKPAILCEIDKNYLKRFNSTAEQIYNFFSQMGYDIFMLKENALERVTSIKEDSNYFLIPI